MIKQLFTLLLLIQLPLYIGCSHFVKTSDKKEDKERQEIEAELLGNNLNVILSKNRFSYKAAPSSVRVYNKQEVKTSKEFLHFAGNEFYEFSQLMKNFRWNYSNKKPYEIVVLNGAKYSQLINFINAVEVENHSEFFPYITFQFKTEQRFEITSVVYNYQIRSDNSTNRNRHKKPKAFDPPYYMDENPIVEVTEQNIIFKAPFGTEKVGIDQFQQRYFEDFAFNEFISRFFNSITQHRAGYVRIEADENLDIYYISKVIEMIEPYHKYKYLFITKGGNYLQTDLQDRLYIGTMYFDGKDIYYKMTHDEIVKKSFDQYKKVVAELHQLRLYSHRKKGHGSMMYITDDAKREDVITLIEALRSEVKKITVYDPIQQKGIQKYSIEEYLQ